MALPKSIINGIAELDRIAEEYPKNIPVAVAAKYMDTSPAGLREMIFDGKCPFGVSWQKDIHGNRVFRIPTLKFYLWHINNAGYESI